MLRLNYASAVLEPEGAEVAVDTLEPARAPRCSIRLPETPGEVACRRCDARFVAAGPTGHAGARPVCDLCLLAVAPELGMVLALVAVTRAFAELRPATRSDGAEALLELGAFARVYDRFAARAGPRRPTPASG